MTQAAGVVIVTYNSAGTIESCLDRCAGLPTVVIDNASADDTRERVRRRQVRLIENPRNRGFGSAVNQGVRELHTDFVLILNPDVELTGSIGPLISACRAPGVGAAAGRLEDCDGRPQTGFTIRRLPTEVALIFEVLGLNRLFPRNPVNRRYRCLDVPLDQPADIEQPAGAFLLFRRDAWDRLGGFDEDFHPLWFEDVDLCRRAARQGHRIRYVPEVTARHIGGVSVRTLNWVCRQRYWYASLLRYASKHFPSNGFRRVSAAVVLASMARAAVETARRRSFEPGVAYAGVAKLAMLYLIRGPMPNKPAAGIAEESTERNFESASSGR